jgi:hypothetical protein
MFNVASAVHGLIDRVISYTLNRGLAHALNAKLEAAIASWQRNGRAAGNQIGAFIHHVNAQRGRGLTGAQADELVDIAEAIVDAINN